MPSERLPVIVQTELKNRKTHESNSHALRLPKINSIDYNGCPFVPTDLVDDAGDLIVLRRLS